MADMRRYRVYSYAERRENGKPKLVGVFEGVDEHGAIYNAFKKLGGDREDYRAEAVSRKVKVKCDDCGATYETTERHANPEWTHRCAVCKAQRDAEWKRHILNKAMRKLVDEEKKAAKRLGVTHEQYIVLRSAALDARKKK